jgi:tetratricopeptide (TPR) repeat protein
LASLVDQSLLRQEEADGEPLFGMLETIREFAQERLGATGEVVELRRRHAEYFLQLAERAVPVLWGPAGSTHGEWLECDHDNLLAALEWCIESDAGDMGLRIGAVMAWLWRKHGFVDARRYMARVLAMPAAQARNVARARALLAAFELGWFQDDYVAPHPLCDESLAIARELGERSVVARALLRAAGVASEQGDLPKARLLLEEGLDVYREIGDQTGIAMSLQNLGELYLNQGDTERAQLLLDESLARYTALGDQEGIGWTHWHLGKLSRHQRDFAAARQRFEKALLIFRQHGGKYAIATMLQFLGHMAWCQSDWQTARSSLEESVALLEELGNRPARADTLRLLGSTARIQGDIEAAKKWCQEAVRLFNELWMPVHHEPWMPVLLAQALEGLATVVAVEGHPAQAVRLCAAADGIREVAGPSHGWEERSKLADCRAALGEDAFAVAWAAGRAMSREEVVAAALQG